MKNSLEPVVLILFCITLCVASSHAEEAPSTVEKNGKSADHSHQDEDAHHLKYYDDIDVTTRGDNLLGIAGSSAEGTTGKKDLEKRPILRVGELVETVPGAVATQHSGGGKANQYFLRGFNLDHGTDFAVSVAGMPVNNPSHGHGQGYADLNFLIPELVDRARFRKGPYHVSTGDFSSAGGVDFDLVKALDEGVVNLTLGSFAFRRALAADTLDCADGDLTAAIEYFHYDGPWDRGDDYRRFNGILAYSRGDAFGGWSVLAMGSDGDWLATDQVPRRAVNEGLIDRYGLIDPGPRGNTSRYSLSAEVHRGDERSLSSINAYAINIDFRLYSNFTYLLEHPDRGDQFEQVDDRWIYGLDLSHRWQGHLGETHTETAIGIHFRYDDIANGLYPTLDLERTGIIRRDDIGQLGAGVWSDIWIRFSDEWRMKLGLRGDYYGADVKAHLSENSGTADDWMLNPKFSLVYRPWTATEFSLNAGSGFHSNDARGATIRIDPVTGEDVQPVTPMVRAKGIDLGVRTYTQSGYHATLTGFWLELDSELVFVGDGGTTEAGRPSRRRGVEWTNYWQLGRVVGVDFDLTWTDAEFTDNDPDGNDIPGAIETTIASGISVSDLGHWFGALRLRYFSGGPLTEDGSVTWGPTALVNGRIGYKLSDRVQFILDAFNLLGREDDDIAYFYASRLPGEPSEGIEDVHFHPMVKPSARVTMVLKF